MNTNVMKSFLDKEFRNYLHFGLCYVGANFVNHKLAKCSCHNCPFTNCRYRQDRRKNKIPVNQERRRS